MAVNPALYQLCQAQMNLLVQSLGVTAGAVYWAEAHPQAADRSPQWMPIVVYPDAVWDDPLPALGSGKSNTSATGKTSSSPQDMPSVLTNRIEQDVIEGVLEEDFEGNSPSLRATPQLDEVRGQDSALDSMVSPALADPDSARDGGSGIEDAVAKDEDFGAAEQTEQDDLDLENPMDGLIIDAEFGDNPALNGAMLPALIPSVNPDQANNYQLLRPLASEGTMLGLLVLERLNQPWTGAEQQQVAEVVNTLVAGFTLVKRQNWLEASFAEREQFYEGQRDRLHDLLHQFKNPLTAIRTFGKLLVKRFQGDESNASVANHVLRESDRLQGMLRNFGDVVDLDPVDVQPASPSPQARSPLSLPPGETVEVPLTPPPQPLALLPTSNSDHPFSLDELLQDLCATADLIARDAHLTLSISPWESLPTVMGDRTTLQEIIGNVLDNALKYTPAGGQVQLQAVIGLPYCHHHWSELADPVPGAVEDALLQRAVNSKRPKPLPHVVLHIQDSGLGIPPDDLAQLFHRRFRGHKTDSDIPGTGLGLAIVRDTLEALGGAIELFSPAIALDSGPPTDPTVLFPSLKPIAQPHRQTGTSVLLWLPLRDAAASP